MYQQTDEVANQIFRMKRTTIKRGAALYDLPTMAAPVVAPVVYDVAQRGAVGGRPDYETAGNFAAEAAVLDYEQPAVTTRVVYDEAGEYR